MPVPYTSMYEKQYEFKTSIEPIDSRSNRQPEQQQKQKQHPPHPSLPGVQGMPAPSQCGLLLGPLRGLGALKKMLSKFAHFEINFQVTRSTYNETLLFKIGFTG